MENIGGTELHVDKSKVYGRSFKDDMTSFYHDISLRNVLAVFGRFTLIKSARHLSDINGLTIEESSNKLECLQNLGLVKLSEKGFELTSNELYQQNFKPSDDVRRKVQAERLLQVAGKYSTCDNYSDGFGVLCTTKERARELKSRLYEVIREFAFENQKIDEKLKDTIVNVGLALTAENLKDPKGDN